jgi:hypothetical protein
VVLTPPGAWIIAPGQTPRQSFFEVFAIGIGLEAAAVEALFSVATVSAARHTGGRPPDNDWDGAARHVDESVTAYGPLPRHENGKPNIARAAALMTEWFNKNEPPAPKDRSIRRWISKNRRPWWGPN